MTSRFLPTPHDLLWIPYADPPSASPQQEVVWNIDFTIDVGRRDADALELKTAEIVQMEALGFRFSSLNRRTGSFRLSLPFATRHSVDHGTLTFLQ